MKTVYILGAGFSVPAGAPVMSEFIPMSFQIIKEKIKIQKTILKKQNIQMQKDDDEIRGLRYDIISLQKEKKKNDDENANANKNIEQIDADADIEKTTEKLNKYEIERKKHNSGIKTRQELIDNLEGILAAAEKLSKDIEVFAGNVQVDVNNMEQLFCLLDIPVDDDENQYRETLLNLIVETFGDICHRYPDRPCRDNDTIAIDADYLKEIGTTQYCTFCNKYQKECVYRAFLSNIIQQHKKIISDSFNEKSKAKDKESVIYKHLDAIITLNYDLVLERAAASFFCKSTDKQSDNTDFNVKLFYGGGENEENAITFVADYETVTREDLSFIIRQIDWRSEDVHKNWLQNKEVLLPIVKIHGSVNWFYSDARCDPRSTIYLGEPGVPNQKITPGRKNRTAIIPPTWNRQLISGSIFQKLINDAIRHLRHADRIVIIGYSMPKTDAYFKYILAKGLSTKTHLPYIEYWQWRDTSGLTREAKLQKEEDLRHEKEAELRELFNPTRMTSGRVKVMIGGIHEFLENEKNRLYYE